MASAFNGDYNVVVAPGKYLCLSVQPWWTGGTPLSSHKQRCSSQPRPESTRVNLESSQSVPYQAYQGY